MLVTYENMVQSWPFKGLYLKFDYEFCGKNFT
jgi:hypothetical protein